MFDVHKYPPALAETTLRTSRAFSPHIKTFDNIYENIEKPRNITILLVFDVRKYSPALA
jgi:hypothetical protein